MANPELASTDASEKADAGVKPGCALGPCPKTPYPLPRGVGRAPYTGPEPTIAQLRMRFG